MWEEWRAEIDRSLREAQLAQRRREDRLEEPTRLYRVTTTSQARREIPATWRLRIGASRTRPIL